MDIPLSVIQASSVFANDLDDDFHGMLITFDYLWQGCMHVWPSGHDNNGFTDVLRGS